MPAGLPRGLKAADVVSAFQKAGGVRRAGRGSHVNLKMPNGQLVTIPVHGDVKTGLLAAATKKAGLSVDEFLGYMGRS